MGNVIVINHLTLDGVIQSPGRPDEDTRDGFHQGGWAAPQGDDAMVAKLGERMGGERAFLFGRRTYEELLTHWNAEGGPFEDSLNAPASTLRRAIRRRSWGGRTRRCSTATSPPPSRSSSRTRTPTS